MRKAHATILSVLQPHNAFCGFRRAGATGAAMRRRERVYNMTVEGALWPRHLAQFAAKHPGMRVLIHRQSRGRPRRTPRGNRTARWLDPPKTNAIMGRGCFPDLGEW